MTIPTQLVLRSLLADPGSELYGIEISRAAGLPSGTVHPILARLERLSWVQSRWEDVDPHVEKRPPRRYYGLTATGVQSAREALASSYRPRHPATSLRPVAQR